METVNCYKRLTNRYNPGWAYLDKSEFVGTLMLTPRKLTSVPADDADHSEGNTYVQYCRVPARVKWKELAQAIRDTMSGSSCQHEWDCCGCSSTYVTVKRHGTRQLRIHTSITYNY